MEFVDYLEDIWNEFKNRIYIILGIVFLILLPYIISAPGYTSIPILSDIFNFGRLAGFFPSTNIRILRIFVIAAILAIFAASWDLLSGYTGQFSFGHAIFWGFSAYIAFWFASGIPTERIVFENFFGPGQPFIIQLGFLSNILGTIVKLDPGTAIIAGGISCAILAIIIGLITLRLKGPYFALVTLIIPFIFAELIRIYRDITSGEFGNPGIPSILETVNDREVEILNFYVFIIAVFFLCIAILILIAYSRIGLAFQSIREDEEAAESLGINLTFYKVLGFAISAFFAGIAGGLFAQLDHFVGPSFLDATNSFTVIIFVVVGGIGSITGGVIGAFMLTLLINFILIDVFPQSTNPGVDVLIYGLVLIISLRFVPHGIVRAERDKKKGIIFGVIFAFSWTLFSFLWFNVNIFQDQISILIFILLFLIALPAIPIYLIYDGIFFLLNLILSVILPILGFEFSTFNIFQLVGLNITGSALIKGYFLIYTVIGIPYAYYLPKFFKKIRIRYWGVWPSVGQYEPE